MRILIVGGGAREHALAWKIKQSPLLKKLYVAPGNPGIGEIAELVPLTKAGDIAAWANENAIDFVVVGPDSYLADGMVDMLLAKNILAFGPTRAAAEIEWSKAFAKELMRKEGIPTARFYTFSSYEDALERASTMQHPIVIKADGLALGKGVVISQTFEETKETLHAFMHDGIHGESGKIVVVEEFLKGREISIHALTDGERVIMFPASQDHKRIFNHNEGPNTGGMGTIAPVPWIADKDLHDIQVLIIEPLLAALSRRGTPFRGLLFPGIMMTSEGPKVIEFNARFGDPETETYMRLLVSDILPALVGAARGDLGGISLEWFKGGAATIMLVSGGYPGEYVKGLPIAGLSEVDNPRVVVLHAATKREHEQLVTNGGRVIAVTAVGEGLRAALNAAYAATNKIKFEGKHHRTDIGAQSLA